MPINNQQIRWSIRGPLKESGRPGRVRPMLKIFKIRILVSKGVFHVVDHDFDVRLLKLYGGRPLLRHKMSI